MKRLQLIALLLLMALPVSSFAKVKVTPAPLPAAGAGGTYWTVKVAVGLTTVYVPLQAGISAGLLFAAGLKTDHRSRAPIITAKVAGGNMHCAWLMATGLTINANKEIVDAVTGTGPGGVFPVPTAPGTALEIPYWDDLRQVHGGRIGLCTTATVSGVDEVTVPCADGTICTTYSAGACDTTPAAPVDLRLNAAVLLACISEDAADEVTVQKTRIQQN